ncbi:hypothetical protein ACIGT4_31720 [Streptomyces sioyaensis]|uniref:hypothetical protein n=1 Tax=Streptomyces sioyaensis TaxID=67364 RepID=UPI0037CF824C
MGAITGAFGMGGVVIGQRQAGKVAREQAQIQARAMLEQHSTDALRDAGVACLAAIAAYESAAWALYNALYHRDEDRCAAAEPAYLDNWRTVEGACAAAAVAGSDDLANEGSGADRCRPGPRQPPRRLACQSGERIQTQINALNGRYNTLHKELGRRRDLFARRVRLELTPGGATGGPGPA